MLIGLNTAEGLPAQEGSVEEPRSEFFLEAALEAGLEPGGVGVGRILTKYKFFYILCKSLQFSVVYFFFFVSSSELEYFFLKERKQKL